MKAPGKSLSDEDWVVWNRVAASIRPLPGRKAPAAEPLSEPAREPVSSPPRPVHPAPGKRPQPPGPSLHHQHGIDRVTRRKIARGRLPIDARIDLHGLVQGEAHALLHGFLHKAHAEGCRMVLVITGKGSSLGSEGVLRRAIPGWLQTPQFRHLVAGFDEASRAHGGEGALYVRLRSQRT